MDVALNPGRLSQSAIPDALNHSPQLVIRDLCRDHG